MRDLQFERADSPGLALDFVAYPHMFAGTRNASCVVVGENAAG